MNNTDNTDNTDNIHSTKTLVKSILTKDFVEAKSSLKETIHSKAIKAINAKRSEIANGLYSASLSKD